MKRWHGSCLGALLVLLICGSSMLFIVPVGGAMLVGIPPVFDKLTGWAHLSRRQAYAAGWVRCFL